MLLKLGRLRSDEKVLKMKVRPKTEYGLEGVVDFPRPRVAGDCFISIAPMDDEVGHQGL